MITIRKLMPVRLLAAVVFTWVALGGVAFVSPEAQAMNAQAQEKEKPKVILLGFDGVDFGLASRFMEEGHLPNLKSLKESGTFTPLKTSNPAQSPVAWASIVTGLNPGKTNIGGFIKRGFGKSNIIPQLATIEDRHNNDVHTISYSDVSWLNHESKWRWISIFAAAFLIIGVLILKLLLRLRVIVSLFGGIVLGGVACYFGISFFDNIPENVPFPYNLQQGDSFWEILSQNDIKTVGLYAPGAYPVVADENADILGGLGVPDINGGPGTWYIYSSEALVFFDMDTNTGGKVVRLDEEADGRLYGKLFGPTNFFRIEQFESQIESLKKRKDSAKLTVEEREEISAALDRKENEYDGWKSEADTKKATVEFFVTPDFEEKEAVFELEGQKQKIKEGEWSEKWFRVKFRLSDFLRIPALVRLRLIKCSDEEVRFFVPAIDISPESPPPYLRISSPAEYCSCIADKLGPYETVGWSCITHGLKDEEISEQVFMEDVEFTMNSRRNLMRNQLARSDWDMFLEIFYTTDRVQHMMYRLFDPEHPQFDDQLAKKTIPFFDRNIMLKDSILEVYKEMDSTVGEVLDRIKHENHGGRETVLMIVSDHGFAPFYYGMGVNNFLIEKGFMTLTANSSGDPGTVQEMLDSGRDNYLAFVDWSKTRAYSLGLGKIFINLKGREPQGIVEPGEDYGSVKDDIIRELEGYVDVKTNLDVVKKVYKREEIFSGSFCVEGDTEFTFYDACGNKFQESRYTEGFADLYIGFNPKYRVSWQTSLGGIEEEVIVPNTQKWSGDHVAVDPEEVRGVFFCNKKINGSSNPSLLDIVPSILSLFGVEPPKNIDGRDFEVRM